MAVRYSKVTAAVAAACLVLGVTQMSQRSSPSVLKQDKASGHQGVTYQPLPKFSPIGTDAAFMGKGDGEGTSVADRAKFQMLPAINIKNIKNMNIAQCKAWGRQFAKARMHSLKDKVGTPSDRRIAAHCSQLIHKQIADTKDAIEKRDAALKKYYKPHSAAKAPVQKADIKKAPVAVAAAKTQVKALKSTVPGWKRIAGVPMHHKFGFNKKLHMGALAQYKREEVANKASKSMKYFKKVGLY
ncbi:hypothetical protein GUITHDRAFT_155714 [Guillardia theta CCMP2712]|uniref:Uncharacterized protein n=1 Tax=Guillardia theta (strain CCMP2712) TaxID=905079 RepID=L1IFC8_GUITC|nr:hypothetical protein GUITHDRAFT_155714 [Guillardia theta CCMP2712]EKX34560.1 hypothetical protein GUITHDRAFT_155714 [Guillardia theta CCMP2712]|eukprot:XP_005821540.1 hypothetical protein GUITHDRAFT_155714 [Guillardia theta CCMP2712]